MFVEMIFEESRFAESQQHAFVEQAIWEVESTARTLVHAFQEHHRVKLLLTHTVNISASECAAHILNMFQRAAKDKRTAYELRWRKSYRRKIPPFGVCVSRLGFRVQQGSAGFSRVQGFWGVHRIVMAAGGGRGAKKQPDFHRGKTGLVQRRGGPKKPKCHEGSNLGQFLTRQTLKTRSWFGPKKHKG